ncbi:MAG: hypothetical protein WBS54_03785, partial [Acidobacteriota bacterium]
LLGLVACNGERTRTVEIALPSEGGIYCPGRGFLYARTSERIRFLLTGKATESDLREYIAVLMGERGRPAPESVKRHEILSSTVQLLLHPPAGAESSADREMARIQTGAMQGQLADVRHSLFDRASFDASLDSVLLPMGTFGLGGPAAGWGFLDLATGSFRRLADGSLLPAARGLEGTRGGPRMAWLHPGREGLILATDGAGQAGVSDLQGRRYPKADERAWSVAWNPGPPCFYASGPKGVFRVDLEGRRTPLRLGEHARFQRIEVSPDGRRMLLFPAGGAGSPVTVELNRAGLAVGHAVPLPVEAAQAPYVVWEPQASRFLWCFDPAGGRAWRVDAAAGKVAGTWTYDASRTRLKAVQTGDSPTVTLTYVPAGRPAWAKALAYLDCRTMTFVGIEAAPPVAKLLWTAAETAVH